MTEPIYRYPGTRPFSSEDEAIFFGRQLDIDRLYQLMTLKNMLIFYSASGMGKSSLIKAGLIPRFKRETNEKSYLPLTIRFCAKAESSDQRKHILLNIVRAELLKHINKLQSTSLAFTVHGDLNESLWCLVKLFEQNNVNLLLIFDQSEEIFTYDKEDINELKEEIYLLFNRNIPTFLHKRIQEKLVVLSNETVRTLGEEISNSSKDTPPTTEDLDTVNKNIEFIYSPVKSKILFAVREDKLGLFNVFSDYFPDILKDTYKLLPLSQGNAREAIEGPSAIQGNFISHPFNYSANALSKLLTNIKEDDDTYDPFSIQLNCSYIEVNCVVKEGKKVIEAGDIPEEGKIVKEYYDNVWKSVQGTEEEIARYRKEIEQKLIDQKQETRKYVYEKDLSNISSILNLLEQKGLIRRDQRGDDHYIELSHDRLIAPLIEASRQRAAEERIKEDYALALKNAAIAEAAAKTRRRRMRVAIGSVVCLSVIMLLYLSYESYRKDREYEMSKAFNSVDKTNPTLAYNIARIGEGEGFKKFKESLKEMENEKLGYITTAFVVPDEIVDAYLDEGQIIVVTKTAISYFRKEGILDSTVNVGGEILKSSLYKGEGGVLIHKVRDYGNDKSKDTFQVKSFKGITKFDFTNDGMPDILEMSANGEKVIADKREITRYAHTTFDNRYIAAVGFFPDGSLIKADYSGTVTDGTNRYQSNMPRSVGAINNSLILVYTENNNVQIINRHETEKIDEATTMLLQKKISGEVSAAFTYAGSNLVDRLACGGDDRDVRIYDISADDKRQVNARLVAMLKGHSGRIVSVNYSSDGKELISTSSSKEVFVWKVSLPSVLYNSGEMRRLSSLDYAAFNLKEKKVTHGLSLKDKMLELNQNLVSFIRLFYSENYADASNMAIDTISAKFETILRPPFISQLTPSQKRFFNSGYANINRFVMDRTDFNDWQKYNRLLNKADSLEINNLLIDTLDMEKLNEYSRKFLVYNVKLRKSKSYDQLEFYAVKNVDLLRSFYIKHATNADIKKKLVSAYTNLSYYLCLTGKYREAIEKSLTAIEIDPQKYLLYTNLALGYLLSGDYNAAQKIYQDYKNKPGGNGRKRLADNFLEDFEALKKAGIITIAKPVLWKQVDEISALMKSK
jgi:tetratricopeptide (TPR) repeat protein